MKPLLRIAFTAAAVAPLATFASAVDRKIEETAQASYNYRTVLERQVKVAVRDGVVTLTGNVEDEAAVALAVATIEDMPGIRMIENQLTAQSPFAVKTDPWIARQIQLRLLVKAKVNAATTTIVVEQGVVTLTGTTQSAAQKSLTEACVKGVAQVKSVNNELTVAIPPAADVAVDEMIDDASITALIRSALVTERPRGASQAAVVIRNGAVGVSGEAASDEERAFITALLETVRGVTTVTNRMSVRARSR
ncbi:MAG: BON domain-containing protein [Verrucomicrobia bacterium]|nr:BON domain-containing protein [Verrucomicrobiota bacterium]